MVIQYRAWPVAACENFLFAVVGYDYSQMNETRFPVILAHTPAGTSVNTLKHFSQVINAGKFLHYDYGVIRNLKEYKRITPPEYALDKITAPVSLFWSDNDNFANPKDVATLVPKLKSLKSNYRVPYKQFSHLDFMWGIDVNKLVYDELLRQLDANRQ